ncbi:MAG: RDD family protein [Candidatus Riflebacteria bacterium]|nr:RDD family protein [Candidatus Riflebacteria bacterium]
MIASIAVLASITRDEPPAGLPGLEGARLATFGRRACAQLIDCVLNVLLGALAGLRSDPWLPTLVGWAIVVCFWTFFGATPGKMAMQLRIVAVSAPERVGLPVATAISRLLGCVVSGIALNLGYLHMIKDPRRQCWHDRWAGTLVVRMGPDPAP